MSTPRRDFLGWLGGSALFASTGLPAYWECMERQDSRDMEDLLDYHRTIRRVDARVYGLPKDDFDDQQNLTISERLFLREWGD